MTQRELDRAVADATGESVSTIAAMGFVPLTCMPGEHGPEDLTPDFDALDRQRRVSVFPRRKPRPAVA